MNDAERMKDAERLMSILRALVEQLHQLWIEKEACERLAIEHGVTYPEVERAKKIALDDPIIQNETREQFSGMWSALENGALSLKYSDIFESLPPTDKPN